LPLFCNGKSVILIHLKSFSIPQHYAMNTHTMSTMKPEREKFFYHGWHHTLAVCSTSSSSSCRLCTGKRNISEKRNRWAKKNITVAV
jgi:hypothetical protein